MLDRPRLRREDAFDLLNVIEVVTCKHAHDVFDGLFTALGVQAVVLPFVPE
ncbi:MAG TPA: hypothetical protein VEV41_27405 [Terriglobales bacterium]|nr:hypothetical protein [Terriglobales bacterium]